MLPNFLIIGAQRAGTTSLYSYLSQHPEIYMCPDKEPHFFTCENGISKYIGTQAAQRGFWRSRVTSIKDYESLFDGVTVEKAIGEASPSYLYIPEIPKRIRHYIPKAKLIAMLRDPGTALFELTYRCNLDCVHCYCKGSEYPEKELTTDKIKDILGQMAAEGCLGVTFTGGEPLLREDFFDIYMHAKRKGLLVGIFTNGILLTGKTLELLQNYPPHSIEITLNGITKETYESITQIEGSFDRVMSNINELVKRKMPLVIKSNCMKQNKHEIAKIKEFTKGLFGEGRKRFKFDPYIYPRLNQDKTPTRYRLTPPELKEIMEADSEICAEYKERLKTEHSPSRDKEFIYQCSSWLTHFFISPYGRLKFCEFIEDFSTDLRKDSFKEGFYKVFPEILKRKFKSDSECRDCELRPFCSHCPGRAYLETGDNESPVPYFYELTKAWMAERDVYKKRHESAVLQKDT